MRDEMTNQAQPEEQGNELDRRVVRALESLPAVQIPADFAARMSARVPARRPVSVRRTHFGYGAMLVSMVALVAALILLAVRGRYGFGHPGVALMVEWVLFAQLVGLAVWLSLRRRGLS